MNVSILSIGDELLFGEIADTNAAAIAAALYDIGVRTQRHVTVGDDEEQLCDAIRQLAASGDIVIATGGLGPTEDDVTAAAAARGAGVILERNPAAMEHLGRMTCKLGGDLSRNEKQALLPAGSAAIPNPVGTACGFRVTIDGCTFFFLPGVPAEMTAMLRETVLPAVQEMTPSRSVLVTRQVRVFGLAEADLGSLLEQVTDGLPGVTVAYAVQYPEIFVKLRGEGDDEARVAERVSIAVERVHRSLGEAAFAEGDDTIDTVVASLFRRTGLTISLAESCTGGLVAKRITDVSGSSAYFLEGAVTYSNEAKERTLRVPRSTLEEFGAVSAETAIAMAQGMHARTVSDIALAITGIAGPEGGTPEKPVGTVFIAVDTADGATARRFTFAGSRDDIRLITAFAALDWLRRHLMNFTD